MAEHSRELFQPPSKYKLFQQQQNTVVDAPCHKIPACAVPDAGEQPYDKNIPHMLPALYPVAAERYIHIIPEPGAKGNVPAPPELRNTLRNIRIIEILQKMEAEHFSKADRHIRIGRKVKIKLKRIGCQSHPCGQHRKLCAGHRPNGIPERTRIVRQQHFFTKADHKAVNALCELLRCLLPRAQLLIDRLVLHDRTCDQLRKHRDIRSKGDEILLHLRLSTVDVDRVGHRLKRIK